MSDHALKTLRKDFQVKGYYRRPTFRILAELLINLSIALGGIAVFAFGSNWVARICGLLVSTAGVMGVGTNTHTSSHYATSRRRWVNQLLTYFGYPLFVGLSATFWWQKHVVTHHRFPNVIGVDADADLSPWFAMTADEIRRATGFRRFYYQHLQKFVFPLALAVNFFNLQKDGVLFVFKSILDKRRRQPSHLIDVACLIGHVLVVIVLPMALFPAIDVLAYYLLRNIFIGYAMFAVLAPAHYPVEAARLSKDLPTTDYLIAQTATTVNFRTGQLGRLICSGLQYQIEHHLFPDISHVYYPKISLHVEKFCRANALPYRQYDWEKLLWKSYLNIWRPGQIQRDSTSLRAAAEARTQGTVEDVDQPEEAKT